jgi:Ala-tRNA(Pro) deacylase
MKCRERLEAYLDEHHVPFQVQQHMQAFTAQRLAESEHISGKMVAKTVIVWADNQMIALVLPASSRVDLDKVQRALGVKELRLAHETEFATTFPDCEVGTMPPFGNLYGIAVYVEKSLAEEEIIVFPVGTYTGTVSLKYIDFDCLAQPKVMEFAQK